MNNNRKSFNKKIRFSLMRFLEMIICGLCATTAINNFKYATLAEITIFALLLLISGTYFLIILIEVLARLAWLFYIPLKQWAIFALMASPMFFSIVVAYFIVLGASYNVWTIIMLSSFVLAGVMFLLEGSAIFFFSKYQIVPLRRSSSESFEMRTLNRMYSQERNLSPNLSGPSTFRFADIDFGETPKRHGGSLSARKDPATPSSPKMRNTHPPFDVIRSLK